jgi:hypothetical protein
VSVSESRERTEELTYGGLSNGESGNKRNDSEGLHDGEGKEGGAAVKERLSLFVL